ncbi:MAG: class I SAM-dependent methyltransferase [Myxococcota bacterium]
MLRFRAPGSTLSAAALVARVFGIPERRAAARVRGGALARATAPRVRIRAPDEPIPPGTALCLEGEAPAAPEVEAAEVWEAITPALPWPSGTVEGFRYETLAEQGGLASLRLRLEDGSRLDTARAWLASAGAPVLGDVVHGGIACRGGLRLAPHRATARPDDGTDELAWPDEPVFPPPHPAPEGALRISAGTARALARGHPWVIADRETERGDRFAPGSLVALRDDRDRIHGTARVEGARALAARRWSERGTGPSIEARVARSLARREALLSADAGTDAARLVHGEADGLPGLAVDRLGPLLRLLGTGRAALPLRTRVVAALLAAKLPGLPHDPAVVEVVHLAERPPGALECVRLVSGVLPEPLFVREGALRFSIDCGLAAPARPRPGVGFFIDQRDNRARVAARMAQGGRALNLFAHTGGFSAALLAGGAEAVVSVDLSAPYLTQLEENLERSGLPRARHRSVRREARRFLAGLDPAERFRGIVIDPPTAAAAGRRFWNVRRDLGPLAAAALARLEPGGFLLLTRQDRSGRRGLAALAREAAASAGVRLAGLERAPPGADFPELPGFPEGAPFEGILATRA